MAQMLNESWQSKYRKKRKLAAKPYLPLSLLLGLLSATSSSPHTAAQFLQYLT